MDNKREQILDATEKLITVKGLHALSMQQVAKEAGVAAGTIYRYFKDKDDLIIQLRNASLETFASEMLAGFDTGTDAERFRQVWFNLVAIDRSNKVNRMTFEQYFGLPGVDSVEQMAYEKVIFADLVKFFEDGVASGKFHQLSIELLFAIAFEPAISLSWKIRRRKFQFPQEELEMACDICWRSLQVHPQSNSKQSESPNKKLSEKWRFKTTNKMLKELNLKQF